MNHSKREKSETTEQRSGKHRLIDLSTNSVIDLNAFGERYGGVTIYFLLLWLIEFAWSIEDISALSAAAMLPVDIDYGYCLGESLGAALGIAGSSYILTKWITEKEVRWGGRLALTGLLLWLTFPDLA